MTLKGKVAIMIPILTEVMNDDGCIKKYRTPTKVAEQGAGYAFGDLALLERKLRAATVVCEEDCDFAVLDKTPFQQILRKYFTLLDFFNWR